MLARRDQTQQTATERSHVWRMRSLPSRPEGYICKGEGGGDGIKQGGNTQQCNQLHWNRDAGRRTAKLIQAQQNYIISGWSSLTLRLWEKMWIMFGFWNVEIAIKTMKHLKKKTQKKHDLMLKLWSFASQIQDRTCLMKKVSEDIQVV